MNTKKTVLIVESEHDTRVSLRLRFEKMGFFIITATSGADALQVIHKINSPTMILINPVLIDMEVDLLLYQIQKIDAMKSCPLLQIGSGDAPLIPGAKCFVSVNDLSLAFAILDEAPLQLNRIQPEIPLID